MLRLTRLVLPLLIITLTVFCRTKKHLHKEIVVTPSEAVTFSYKVSGSLTKRLILDIDNLGAYAGLSVFADDELLFDDFNIPTSGPQIIMGLFKFKNVGTVDIKFQSLDEILIINNYYFEDLPDLNLPIFKDISTQAGLDKVISLKYGGPSIADIDNDEDYDFIVNNHNAETSKLYWNNGDGTVTKHDKDLARWFKHDLHGTSLGDYDNDGDLDLVLAQGGGNGTNPSKANFYHNDNNTLVRYTGDVGIKKGGRGRGSKWIDADLDGDLDLLLINEASLAFDKPQHFFYENNGDGTFEYRTVKGIEDIEESRVLVSDINNDNIDDLIFYSPLTIWKGNGDFTFTEITNSIPEHIRLSRQINAITDIDIDNDGDFDLYLARGKLFEHGKEETPSVDFNPRTKELSIKTRGYEGTDVFEFTAKGSIKLEDYYYLAQGEQLGKDYPIFLGENRNINKLESGEELDIDPQSAIGWPNDISKNGFYVGYLGNSNWKAVLVRNGKNFWQYKFSLVGVSSVKPDFIPQNRNQTDFLLRNDGSKFVDVSSIYNIPKGGNAMGVTNGDFNNDSHQDLFIYRWGRIGARISDLMLLNTGNDSYETTTMHRANDIGGPGNGDMGQAFDFDMDGKVDLLNGSEGGEWYLYSNESLIDHNYIKVKVGYSPESNVDPMSAEVIVTTQQNEYRKRVGSSGEVFSQSLMNIVHFGLGEETTIKQISIRWRNGETVKFKNKTANSIIDTDKLDPESIHIEPFTIRKGSKVKLSVTTIPTNSNNQVTWSTSNKSIITVDSNGIITACGDVNQSAYITAISEANGLTNQIEIQIVEWYPKPVTSIALETAKKKLFTGQKTKLNVVLQPNLNDNSEIIYTSDNDDILKVNEFGEVHAISPGTTSIRASLADRSLHTEIEFVIEPQIEPYIKIANKESYENKSFIVGDSIRVSVNYHAGSGNKVISADEGGIRFWLRHFKSKWIPVKDIVLTHEEALYKESGDAYATISLNGTTPVDELPNGHFYQLRVTFTSSDGNMYSDDILPLQIIKNND